QKGVSANQIKRTINVSYKTAWYLCHPIRAPMTEADPPMLTGIVEVDETYVGGKVRGKGHGYIKNKAIVVGAIQRHGGLVLQVVGDTRKPTLQGFIHEHVAGNAEAIYTDEHPSYRGIGDANTRHETVNHSAEEWARGDVTTNDIEGVWSLFKRSVIGTYHQLSEKHLDAYLDELEWRFKNRENPYLFRDTLVKLINSENLPYQQLVKQ
ncbi:MAG: IS1595 family transposase, partial [Chloroflexi bacterium]|nr:IS1595 family transposase [Chloroflexota bacterium]